MTHPEFGGERSEAQDEVWARFYAKANAEPRPWLLEALEHFDGNPAQSVAVDCGCGNGRDSLQLLRSGFRVFAFDRQPEAIELTKALVEEHGLDGFEVHQAGFEDVQLPDCDLVVASLSLFFATRPVFDGFWRQLRAHLRPGGLFCGQLLGPRDEWLERRPHLTSHSREQLDELFEGFEVLSVNERDERGLTSSGEEKHWHLFTVIARR